MLIPDDMEKAFHFIGPYFNGLKAVPISRCDGCQPDLLFVKTQFLYQLASFIKKKRNTHFIHFKNHEWILISSRDNGRPLVEDEDVQAVVNNARNCLVEGAFASKFHVRPGTNDSQVVEEVRTEYFPVLQRWMDEGVFGDKPLHAVDLGGHIGSFSIQLGCLLGDRVKIHTYEPEPGNFEQIRKNIGLNGIDNVISYNEAVSAKKGSGVLFLNPEHRGASQLNRKLSYKTEKVAVPVVSFGDVCDRLSPNKIDILKIDVEGSEYDTLLPVENLGKKVRALVGEAQRTDKHTPDDLVRYLEEQGYEVQYKGYEDLMIFSAIRR